MSEREGYETDMSKLVNGRLTGIPFTRPEYDGFMLGTYLLKREDNPYVAHVDMMEMLCVVQSELKERLGQHIEPSLVAHLMRSTADYYDALDAICGGPEMREEAADAA